MVNIDYSNTKIVENHTKLSGTNQKNTQLRELYEAFYKNRVTIQNDKNLYTCTKEILKYRIAGLRMKKV